MRKIDNLIDLYTYAEEQGYDVYWYNLDLDGMESLSVMRMSDGKRFIAIDPYMLRSNADEMVKVLHELGHAEGVETRQRYRHGVQATGPPETPLGGRKETGHIGYYARRPPWRP